MNETELLDTADRMARAWAESGIDPNEVGKVLSFLREAHDGAQLFRFLDTVIAEGESVVRSGRTMQYYRQIRQVCRQHLHPYQDYPEKMCWILGWAIRLMRYYAVEDKIGVPRAVRKPRPAAPAAPGRHSGCVRWFDAGKRYGFIEPDGGGENMFVHLSQVMGHQPLHVGQRVSYVIGSGTNNRPQAQDVRPE